MKDLTEYTSITSNFELFYTDIIVQVVNDNHPHKEVINDFRAYLVRKLKRYLGKMVGFYFDEKLEAKFLRKMRKYISKYPKHHLIHKYGDEAITSSSIEVKIIHETDRLNCRMYVVNIIYDGFYHTYE